MKTICTNAGIEIELFRVRKISAPTMVDWIEVHGKLDPVNEYTVTTSDGVEHCVEERELKK